MELKDTKTMTKAVNNRFKITKSFKDAAMQVFPVFVWKNKEKTIVSSKRNVDPHLIVRKRLTKASNLNPYVPPERATFVKATNHRIEFQEYYVFLHFKNGIEYIEFNLVNFMKFEKDTVIKCHTEGNKIINGLKPCGLWYRAFSGPIYSNYNFQKSELRYVDFEKIYSNFHSFPNFLERVYKYRREIEFCQKVGAFEFADGIACNNSYIDMRSVTRKWLKANKRILKKNPSPEYFASLEKIEELAKRIQIKPNRLFDYLLKHKLSVDSYNKHIENIKCINYPLNKMYILPENFEQIRDEVLEIVTIQRFKKRNIDFLKATKYFKEVCNKTLSGCVFSIPDNAESMVKTGMKMNNCLKNYIDQVISGKSIIVLIKDTRSNNRLYALELSPESYNIRQLKGKNNTTPPKKIQRIVDKYAQSLLVA
ncbi:PcfJ domain-containing protein [Ligilactobacillus faecis]|uniref:PcfJ domain-containing protein n=1 Tax=Ligilactobacillus faecis TaxID=762833 RepID=A0ABV4DN48_9LACO